jgi:hypothetical protein
MNICADSWTKYCIYTQSRVHNLYFSPASFGAVTKHKEGKLCKVLVKAIWNINTSEGAGSVF